MRAVLVDAPESLEDRRGLGLDKQDESWDAEWHLVKPPKRWHSRVIRPLRRGAVGVAVVLLLGACGGGSSTVPEDTGAGAALSPACRQAFVDGHDLETAGRPTNEAFLPSIEACGSMAEWTAAAMDFGVDLQGREATFVDGVCAAAEEATRASDICRQAQEQFRRGT